MVIINNISKINFGKFLIIDDFFEFLELDFRYKYMC